MSDLTNVILSVCLSGQNRVSLVSLGAGGITGCLTRRVGAVDPLHSSLPPRPFLCRRPSTSNENTEENQRSESSADTRTQCSAEISVTLSPEPPETQLKLISECVNVKPSGSGVTLACQTSCMRPVTSEHRNLNLWCLESFTWAGRPQVTSLRTVTVRYDVFPPSTWQVICSFISQLFTCTALALQDSEQNSRLILKYVYLNMIQKKKYIF